MLFTIYGAVLEATGAGRFFIDLSFSLFRRSRSAPGRTVVASGFLLGSVSGSGTATAVSLGSVAWPILKRAGYPKEAAGGMLAAAGIGAILSPPTLGAAAFIIAEYLETSYLNVLVWAIVPTILYYLGILLAVEIDARRFVESALDMPRRNPWRLLARFGYHFLSLLVIVAFLAMDIEPFRAVVYATAVAAAFGLAEWMLSRRDPMDPEAERLSAAGAARGYVVERVPSARRRHPRRHPDRRRCVRPPASSRRVIVKTGLGQSLADVLVSAGEAVSSNPDVVLIVTAVLAAGAILVLGLAVPVTASFIISWVVIGPALQTLGVEAPATAMFIFYYAVLSEVSPPTALAAVAAAAITGGNTIATMWQACKYTLPAFLAPLAFVVTDNGSNLLMEGRPLGVVWTTAVSLVAVAALAAATGGWIAKEADPVQRGALPPGRGAAPVPPADHDRRAAWWRWPSPWLCNVFITRKETRMRTHTWSSRTVAGIVGVAASAPDPLGLRRAAGPGPGRRGRRRPCTASAGQVTIATGNSTGVYYVMGGGIAS